MSGTLGMRVALVATHPAPRRCGWSRWLSASRLPRVAAHQDAAVVSRLCTPRVTIRCGLHPRWWSHLWTPPVSRQFFAP